MRIDAIKALFTYSIALILIVGGLVFLYFTRLDPPSSSSSILIPLVAGFIGAAIQFVFGQEAGTRASRMTEKALLTPPPTINGGTT